MFDSLIINIEKRGDKENIYLFQEMGNLRNKVFKILSRSVDSFKGSLFDSAFVIYAPMI